MVVNVLKMYEEVNRKRPPTPGNTTVQLSPAYIDPMRHIANCTALQTPDRLYYDTKSRSYCAQYDRLKMLDTK